MLYDSLSEGEGRMKRKSVSRALGIFLTGVMTLSSVPVMPVWAENVEGVIEESDIEDTNRKESGQTLRGCIIVRRIVMCMQRINSMQDY